MNALNLGHYRRRTETRPDHNYPSHSPRGNEWSRILTSLAKTGFVALKKSKTSSYIHYATNEDESEVNEDDRSFNLGGMAEARRPNQVGKNQTRTRKPNRKPRPNLKKDEDEDVKKKPNGGIPWMFNLIGPPGKFHFFRFRFVVKTID